MLERSADLGEFNAVSEVLAKGNTISTQQYGATDTSPLDGPNYYRLKQVDGDGSVHYSRLISAVVRRDAVGMVVYPNPSIASGNRVHLQLFNAEKATFQLHTLTGQCIPGHIVSTSRGEVDFVADSLLATGLYILEMSSGPIRQTVRVAVP
ncbi:T9SS type A sorting domain-containing protein [Spirosoma jeollabukense]